MSAAGVAGPKRAGWAQVEGEALGLAGKRWVRVERPRLRRCATGEGPDEVPAYRALRRPGTLAGWMLESDPPSLPWKVLVPYVRRIAYYRVIVAGGSALSANLGETRNE